MCVANLTMVRYGVGAGVWRYGVWGGGGEGYWKGGTQGKSLNVNNCKNNEVHVNSTQVV